MGPEYAVRDDLQSPQVDDHEAAINGQVQDGDKWVAEHLFLSESQQDHVLPATTAVSGIVFLPAQQDIPAYSPYPHREKADGCHQDKDERDLLKKQHRRNLMMRLR